MGRGLSGVRNKATNRRGTQNVAHTYVLTHVCTYKLQYSSHKHTAKTNCATWTRHTLTALQLLGNGEAFPSRQCLMVRVLTGYCQPDTPTQCNLRMHRTGFSSICFHMHLGSSAQGKYNTSVPTIPAAVLNAILVPLLVSQHHQHHVCKTYVCTYTCTYVRILPGGE